jgi:hypothetical protein
MYAARITITRDMHMSVPQIVLVLLVAAWVADGKTQETSPASETSFSFKEGKPGRIRIGRYIGGPPGTTVYQSTPMDCDVHTHWRTLEPLRGKLHIYATFNPLRMNPVDYADGQPACRQTLTLGLKTGNDWRVALTVGVVDDNRASPAKKANYVPGLSNGKIEYYGMFMRPCTPYDLKMAVDLDCRRMTAFVSGRGDDEWFPLAVDAELAGPIELVNSLRVDQGAASTGIQDAIVQTTPWPEGEEIRPHPRAKKRAVQDGQGFRFQPMRSLWMQAGRHVTVARTPNEPKNWWLGFPDVVQTGPTSFVCVHNDGAGHGGAGRVWARLSNDLGKTWPKAVVVHPGPTNTPRIEKLKDGSLVISADMYPGPYRVFFFRSADGGATWTHVGVLHPVEAGGHDSCVPSRVKEMSDGSWLVAASMTRGKAFNCDGEVLEFYRSTDQGKTWKYYSRLEGEPPHSLSEPSIVEPKDGRWLLFAREGYGRLPGVRSLSTDQGKTWSRTEDMAFGVHGRTCAGLLSDGRVLMTFRACYGPVGLWAWIDEPEAKQPPLVSGAHFNDRRSCGLKDGALHIDSDGLCGQFTKYSFRCPNSGDDRIEVTAECRVESNAGKAATVAVPYVGRLRVFPDHAEFARDPNLRFDVRPDRFHTYRVVVAGDKAAVSVDGQETLRLPKRTEAVARLAWSPVKASVYPMEFGNEMAEGPDQQFDWAPDSPPAKTDSPAKSGELASVLLNNITPAVTGYSLWRRVEVRYADARGEYYKASWNASENVFPDQYQLDHMILVDASIAGVDEGYSGWRELPDGRVFVVNYTDDTARWNCDASYPPLGVSWIRGTFIRPEELRKPH